MAVIRRPDDQGRRQVYLGQENIGYVIDHTPIEFVSYDGFLSGDHPDRGTAVKGLVEYWRYRQEVDQIQSTNIPTGS